MRRLIVLAADKESHQAIKDRYLAGGLTQAEVAGELCAFSTTGKIPVLMNIHTTVQQAAYLDALDGGYLALLQG